jgi:hypothetical protein
MKTKKGFIEGTLPQLLLVLISFAVIAMIISNIFSGTGSIQEKLCLAVPFFCGTQTGIDYEISARSANAMACAIGSSFNGFLWQGGSDFTCDEFYTQPASGANTSGVITGAASSDEPLRLSQVRTLKPSVSCSKDSVGKMTCVVRNFTMPQGVTEKEKWIPYYGDPDFLVYWNSFPAEEDTWNFEVNWLYHSLIAGVSLIGPGKAAGFSFKTFWIALKGPGKTALATKATEEMLEKGSQRILFSAVDKLAATGSLDTVKKEVLLKVYQKSVTKTMTEAEAQMFQKEVLSKLTKSEMKEILEDVGIRYTKKQAIMDLLKKQLIPSLEERIKKRPGLIFGEFLLGEVGLNLLADSVMKKYEPLGNAIAIKSPGTKPEDLKIFELPESMEGRPVLMKWKPEGGSTEIKSAHLASPCYLNEFNISKEDNIVCGQYSYDLTTKSVLCNDVQISKQAPLYCEDYYVQKRSIFDSTTTPAEEIRDMSDKIDLFLGMSDRRLFQIDSSDGKWDLEKIYLPWFLSDDNKAPRYYIKDFVFVPGDYKYGKKVNEKPTGIIQTIDTTDIKMGSKIDSVRFNPNYYGAGDDYAETYDANLNCDGCVTLNVVDNEDKVLMSGGKRYILRIQYVVDKGTFGIAANDVSVDVYEMDKCTYIINMPSEHYQPSPSCDVLKAMQIPKGEEQALGGGVIKYFEVTSTTSAEQVKDIKDKIREVKDGDNKILYYVEITPEKEIKASDVNELGDISDCGDSGGSGNCFRIFDTGGIPVHMECIANGHQETKSDKSGFINGVINESCGITSDEISNAFNENVDYPIRITRHISYNESLEVTDITYSSISFWPGEPTDNYIWEFLDSEENGKWDELSVFKKPSGISVVLPDCIFGRDKNSFAIKFSDVQDDGKYQQIYMENCKTSGVMITFNDNRPSKSAINTEVENYCAREVTGLTRVATTNVVCGISLNGILSTAATVAAVIAGDGVGAMLAVAAVSAAPEIAEEVKTIWPG